jgi:2-dehydro-3-deoxyphosphogluconate aldolase/(4S)-4-hydroxy-2-oxoglutarate aldolase
MTFPRSASEVKAAIVAGGVIGIVRTSGPEPAVDLARQIWAAGVDVVEVALTTPRGLQAIETLARDLEEGRVPGVAEPGADGTADGSGGAARRLVLGAGTVLDAATARLAILAGARVLVTPTLTEDVIEVGQRYGVTTVIGCATPTEMLRATALGADLVKVFPASQWSPATVADVLAALPQLEVVPTGGVSPEDAADWIRAGARAVGIGSGLTKGADPAARVKTLLASLREARPAS